MSMLMSTQTSPGSSTAQLLARCRLRRRQDLIGADLFLVMAVACATPPDTSLWKSWIQLPQPLTVSLLDDAPIEFVKAELKRCVDSCDASDASQGDFLPTRLLDVSGSIPRLVTTRAASRIQDTDARYLALSYCWGNGNQLKLTQDSIDWMTRGIPLELLAPVQIDTIALAKALSIPYVWIDALCILQDDHDDWCRESSSMHKIYATSYLTVCALSTTSCQQGYLSRRSPMITVPCHSKTDDTGYFHLQPFMWTHDRNQTYSGITPGSTWSTRAWTYQEQGMATRLLYVTSAGFTFSCSSWTISEHSNLASNPRKDVILAELLASKDPETLYKTWAERVIANYSPRELTQNQDRLPALSGLAQIFGQSLPGDEYAAGLWRNDLHRGLGWILRIPPHESLSGLLDDLSDNDSYIGPSWSWISRPKSLVVYDEELVFYKYKSSEWIDHQEFELLSMSITKKGLDNYGQISQGTLSVRAYVYKLSRKGNAARDANDPRNLIYTFGDQQNHACLIRPDWRLKDEKQNLCNLSFVLIGSGSSEDEPRTSLHGLVVHAVGASGTYFRVGTFWPTLVYNFAEPSLQFFRRESILQDIKLI
ncbi:hypothetical protein PFICI_14584 [Pestalotiopsis fici W106-1]|uniref:Heterokaryon incompatibility domain-containing protein n=1 Tax=Pestalotiopsis fici (strain W106-1 / CGMCC3.15140) TaxID=1229662 RepID=W3WIC8_PESFW|nr:uncharacterized protein PFICI_14584 [Pestalotiopsis fici W106-1]ETS73638.1 hypothetical protein PFICI_14584 [Pestalotiopsis fici W106-1]